MRFRLLSAGASNGLTPRRPRSFYTANGDNHSQRPDRFKRLLEIAKKHNGEFNIDAVNELYGQNAELSLSNNPKLYMEGYTLVVIVSPALLTGVELGRRLTGIGTIPAARSLSDQYVCAFPPSQRLHLTCLPLQSPSSSRTVPTELAAPRPWRTSLR